MLFADFPIANRCKIWFGFGLLYCTKSSTLWGAALFVLHGFYGAAKGRIRTARAPRFASRGAETPRWGVSRARLGEFLRAHQKAHCNVFLQCVFLMLFRFRIILVAYHLRHQCIALLPVDHFSTDLCNIARILVVQQILHQVCRLTLRHVL